MAHPRHHGRNFRNNRTFKYRKNERIRLREVRVIGPDEQQLGVMATRDALDLAKKLGLDLVEVAPQAKPSVCRILDFGKFMYEQSKKSKDSKSTASKIKEVKFRVRIEQHDYITKLRHAEEFLNKGFKVKLTLTLRGRENQFKDIAMETMKRAMGDLTHIGSADFEPRIMGNRITAMMSPLPENKRKLKYNVEVEEEAETEERE